MDFGLGLILSFTDKASAGIYGAIGTLSDLQSAAETSVSKVDALRNSLSALGSLGTGMTAALTAPIVSFMGKITQYGIGRASFVEDTHLAFTSLMGDAQTASNFMQSLMNFAKTTPFTYEGITSTAQLLISYGIEAEKILSGIDEDMDGILDAAKDGKSEFGGFLQAIGDWAGATGRGEGGMMHVANILGDISAEGKVTGMRLQQLQLAGVQASDMIGNLHNLSGDEAYAFIRSMKPQDFINDLIKGIEEGTTGPNVNTGAMAGQMMNLKKTWTGAKDTFVSALKSAGLSLMGSYTDDYGVTRYTFLENMTEALNNISSAVKLIPSILQPLMDTINEVMNKGSELIKEFAQKWADLPDTVKKGIGKVLAFVSLLGPALILVSKLGGGVMTLFKVISMVTSSGLIPSLMSLLPVIALVAGAIYLLYKAWDEDFAGMKTTVTEFTDNIKTSFNDAKEAVSGSYEDMINAMNEKKIDPNSFWGRLTTSMMKISVIIDALKEGWDDATISDDTYKKAEKLDVLGIVEGFFDVQYRFEEFAEGFKSTWEKQLKPVIQDLFDFGNTKTDGDAFKMLDSFFKMVKDTDPKKFRQLGEDVASFPVELKNFTFKDFVEGWEKCWYDVFHIYTDGMSELGLIMIDGMSELGYHIVTWFVEGAKELGEIIVGGFIEGASEIGETFVEEMVHLWEDDVIPGATRLGELLISPFVAIGTFLKDLFKSVTEEWRLDFSTLETLVSSFSTSIQNAISGLYDFLASKLDGISPKLSALFRALGVTISANFSASEEPHAAEGGIVTRPTRALIGEAGAEAIMPLKNNTEWIGMLADDISSRMISRGSSNEASRGNVDNSVVFNEGAIQINCKDASEEEAQRLAKRIIAIIKRQKEIDDITSYAY